MGTSSTRRRFAWWLAAAALSLASCGQGATTPVPTNVTASGLVTHQRPVLGPAPTDRLVSIASGQQPKGAWLVSFTGAADPPSSIVLILTSPCSSDGCAIDTAIQTTSGAPLGAGTFTRHGGRYRLQWKTAVDAGCSTAKGWTAISEAPALIDLSVVAIQPAGSAVVSLRMSGTATVDGTKSKAKCQASTIYTAVGTETFLVAASTPQPPATPSPTRPQPRPASGGGTTGGGVPGPPAWYVRLVAYDNSAVDTYSIVVETAYDLYGNECVPGATPEECDARNQEALLVAGPALKSINRHIAWMTSHSASSCFAAAYRKDKTMGEAWITRLTSGNYPGELTGQGRAAGYEWDAAISATNAFLSSLSNYYRSCQH